MTTEAIFSSMVRSGRATYFIDVKEAKDGRKYLAITENTFDAGDKKTRTTIRVSQESVDHFLQAVSEAARALNV
jgi:hypothetical protein